jgi:hypothetical protein
MLTGQLPYGYEAKLDKPHYQLNYTSVCHYNSDLQMWIDCALKKAVHPSPSRRYGSLSEFLHDFSHPNPSLLSENDI